jgi:hypothetical protein
MKRCTFLSAFLAVLLILAACSTSTTPSDVDAFVPEEPADPRALLFTDDPRQPESPRRALRRPSALAIAGYLEGQAADRRPDRQARNMTLVGHLELDHPDQFAYGDVVGYRNLAFVGKWGAGCPGSGVDIVDISDPANPVRIASTLAHEDTATEAMRAIRIGNRDVLAVGLQDCSFDPTSGKAGLELYDITDPHSPQPLSFFDVHAISVFPFAGVYALELTKSRGRTLALLAVPDLEAYTWAGEGTGVGDLLIVDITDPRNPLLIGEWGVIDEPELGLDVYLDAGRGSVQGAFLFNVRANQSGSRAYLSYWDGGFIILDIGDPTSPRYLGRTEFAPDDEGNATAAVEARGGRVLVGTEENLNPFKTKFSSSAFEGTRNAAEAWFTPPLAKLGAMEGEIAHVGRGCPAGSIDEFNPDDPYLADPAGKLALIERGACRFDHKIARAELAGATGVIVYNNQPSLFAMGGENPVTLPDGMVVPITIPAVIVEESTGGLLLESAPPVTARAASVFAGWGPVRIFDISDPANPVTLSTFLTENSQDEAIATEGIWWSAHLPEVRGNTAYVSWLSDGLRLIDISQPTSPREIGFWTGAGAPDHAPPVFIWGVVPHGNLLLVSDINFGLYILKEKHGPGR